MALLIAEGFEHIHGSVDAGRRFTDSVTGIPTSLAFQAGRLPNGRCLRAQNGESFTLRSGALSPGSTTAILGVAVRANGNNAVSAIVRLVNAANAEQLSLSFTDIGGLLKVELKRGAAVLATSPTFPLDQFIYVELFATVDATLGVWELRINEMTIASGTGNTANAGGAGFSKLLLNLVANVGVTNYFDIDDLYLLSSTGEAPLNQLLGAIGIESVVPFRLITEGTFPWTPNTGTNEQAVDDGDAGPVDDDATYVAYTLQDKMDLYQMNKIRSVRSSMLNLRLSEDLTNTDPVDQEPFHTVSFKDKKINLEALLIAAASPYARYKTDAPPVTSEVFAETLYGYANTIAAQAIPQP